MELKLVSSAVRNGRDRRPDRRHNRARTGSRHYGAGDVTRPPGDGSRTFTRPASIKGKAYETVVLHRPQGLKARRLMLAGAGKDSDHRRSAAGQLRRALEPQRKAGRNMSQCCCPEPGPEMVAAAAEGRYSRRLGKRPVSNQARTGIRSRPAHWLSAAGAADLETALERARIVAESQNFARDLQNEPPNVLGPMALAEQARTMAAEQGLECEVLDQDQMRQLGMGSLLAVAQGSAQPPALIVTSLPTR